MIVQSIDEQKVKQIMKAGHPYLCAMRQVFGDGECECELYKKDYNPNAWMENSGEVIGDDDE